MSTLQSDWTTSSFIETEDDILLNPSPLEYHGIFVDEPAVIIDLVIIVLIMMFGIIILATVCMWCKKGCPLNCNLEETKIYRYFKKIYEGNWSLNKAKKEQKYEKPKDTDEQQDSDISECDGVEGDPLNTEKTPF